MHSGPSNHWDNLEGEADLWNTSISIVIHSGQSINSLGCFFFCKENVSASSSGNSARSWHWRVEVGWDGDSAFLGRGWPEFADACGVEAGWLLILRHRGHGLLTVKAFDANCCLIRELHAPAPPAGTQDSRTPKSWAFIFFSWCPCLVEKKKSPFFLLCKY